MNLGLLTSDRGGGSNQPSRGVRRVGGKGARHYIAQNKKINVKKRRKDRLLRR